MVSTCIKCGLPSTIKGVSILKSGECTYCNFHRKHSMALFDRERIKELFQKRIDRIKGKYPYDALVGISGGKDGTYVLHRLVRDYGLKVLAVTYDHGFLDPSVKGKIEELVKIYGVDHQYHYPENLKSLYRGVLKATGIICDACSLGGYYGSVRMMLQYKIPMFVHGRSTYQMIRNLDEKAWKKDLYVALIKGNLKEYDPVALNRLYKKMYNLIKWKVAFLRIGFKEKRNVMNEYFSKLKSVPDDFVPESFAYFLTEEYDENRIRRILKEDVGYVCPPSHNDCTVHNAAHYLISLQKGACTGVLEAAAMVRSGVMNKNEFEKIYNLKKQETENPSKKIKEELQRIEKIVNINLGKIGHPSPQKQQTDQPDSLSRPGQPVAQRHP